MAAVSAAEPGVSPAVSHSWLRDKLNKAGVMWREAVAHAHTCHGALDGCAWVQLDDKMQMARAENEQFWQNAVKIQSAAVVLV